jgi:DNA-binding transcriptional MerR regulator
MPKLSVHIPGRYAYNALYVNVNFHSKHNSFQLLDMATYTITELAREFDITPRAIRFYEDQGLLSPRREGAGGRTRVYSGQERTRLKLTLRGKRLGLSLLEIKSLVDMYESPKDTTAQLERFLKVLGQHRENMERQREDLEVTLAEITAHEKECLRLLEKNRQEKPGAGTKKSAPRKLKDAA